MPEQGAVHRFEPADLVLELLRHDPRDAAELLETVPDEAAVEAFGHLNPSIVQDILLELDRERRESIIAAAPGELGTQWARNQSYKEDTVGRLMEPALAVFPPETTIEQTIESLRQLVRKALITYLFVTDHLGRLLGVITMRDLLLNRREERLGDIMLKEPFFLRPEMMLSDAMKEVLPVHLPVYPVCDDAGQLVGVVRGRTLFEEQAIEISAQAGSMVGVEKEERLTTPWPRSLRFRHPWLQLNVFTAFLAATVVGLFQETIDRLVVLAVFLPVLAGQSGNTGSQALAVTLRGVTLGELQKGKERLLVLKEALLGLLNGSLVGLTAGLGMLLVASAQKNPHALLLGLIVFLAMIGSCVVSGIAGVIIPLTLRKLGADPATASSIFLTTATDVVSMGLFLGLATLLVRGL